MSDGRDPGAAVSNPGCHPCWPCSLSESFKDSSHGEKQFVGTRADEQTGSATPGKTCHPRRPSPEVASVQVAGWLPRARRDERCVLMAMVASGSARHKHEAGSPQKPPNSSSERLHGPAPRGPERSTHCRKGPGRRVRGLGSAGTERVARRRELSAVSTQSVTNHDVDQRRREDKKAQTHESASPSGAARLTDLCANSASPARSRIRSTNRRVSGAQGVTVGVGTLRPGGELIRAKCPDGMLGHGNRGLEPGRAHRGTGRGRLAVLLHHGGGGLFLLGSLVSL